MDSIEPRILRAGVGRTDITPPPDCFLEGFTERNRCASGIRDHLKATALALSDGNSHAVIVSLDIIDLPDNLVEAVWSKVRIHYHIEPYQMLINSSHTHAGPMTWPRLQTRNSPCPDHRRYFPDERYIHILVENIVTAVGKSMGNIRPAQAKWGCGETRIGICRRARNPAAHPGYPPGLLGLSANCPNPGKTTDVSCPVIFFTDMQERPLACVFGAACHPTTMRDDNYLVSAEYPGAAGKIIEERLGAPALFLQGAAGDVNPGRVAQGDIFRSGTFEDVDAVGAELAEDVFRTMAGMQPLELRLRHAMRRFPVPLDPNWDEAAYQRYLGEEQPEHRRNWAEWRLEKIRSGEPAPREIPIAVSILELSDALRFLGISGELLTDMGFKLKSLFPRGTTLPLGYSNGRTGYIPDSNVLREGGYEALESIFFTPHMPAPWREDIDDTLIAAVQSLERELNAK